jgi:hypothetical protein
VTPVDRRPKALDTAAIREPFPLSNLPPGFTLGLSNAAAVVRGAENPYGQHACSETIFQPRPPLDPSSLTRWRGRMCEERVAWLPTKTFEAGRGPGVSLGAIAALAECTKAPLHKGEQRHRKLRSTLTAWAEKNGIGRTYIQPRKPQQNAYVERHNRPVRHEWPDFHILEIIEEAKKIAAEWLWARNNGCPDMRIGGVTPAMKVEVALCLRHRRPVKTGISTIAHPNWLGGAPP